MPPTRNRDQVFFDISSIDISSDFSNFSNANARFNNTDVDEDDAIEHNKEHDIYKKVIAHLSGEKVDGVDDNVAKYYFTEVKRTRFLSKEERRLLNKPTKDVRLTSSVMLDDIVPSFE